MMKYHQIAALLMTASFLACTVTEGDGVLDDDDDDTSGPISIVDLGSETLSSDGVEVTLEIPAGAQSFAMVAESTGSTSELMIAELVTSPSGTVVFDFENDISINAPSFNHSNAFGSIDWNQVTGTLTIDGIVRVNGNLDIADKAAGVLYNGTGTLYAVGDVAIHGHLMPQDNYLQTSTLTYDNLGIIADNNLDIATGGGETWVKVMAALYAQNATNIKKQSRIAGAIVTLFFDMGNNVPRIFQAANLSHNLPPGMPGGDPMLFVTGADVTNWYQVRQ